MTATPPERAAFEAWHRSRYPGQPPEVAAARWASYGSHAKSGWEAVAEAVAAPLREQARLARQDRDQLRKAVLSLAARYGDVTEDDRIEGQVPGSLYMTGRAEALNVAAARLRKIAGPPS